MFNIFNLIAKIYYIFIHEFEDFHENHNEFIAFQSHRKIIERKKDNQ